MPRLLHKLLPVAVIIGGIALLAGIVALYARTERMVIARHNHYQLVMVSAVGSALGKEVDRRLDRFAVTVRNAPLAVGQPLPPALEEQLAQAGFHAIFVRNDPSVVRPGPLEAGPVILREREPNLPVRLPAGKGIVVEAQLGFSAFGPLIETWNERVGGRLWLLDDSGRLIYSKLHPNMLGRSALGNERRCFECHQSFHMERAMVNGQAAAVEHQVGDRPKVLVCYAPVRFAGRRWSLAMSDPQAEITSLTRRGFLQASLLTALFLALVVATAIGLMRLYQQKLQAERRVAVAENKARLEARMARAEQLAAVGKMTAQIAHEINTPLASISLNVTYVLGDLQSRFGELPPHVMEAAGEIQHEVERLKTFTSECLKLTRMHTPQLQNLSLTAVVRGFLSFVSREARRRNVQLQAAFESEAVYVRGDGDLLRQVLLNLTRNAFDAMPSGGALEITLFRRGDHAELAVSDTGPGVPDDLREKVFDTFFTTKPEGTGLGLAVVRRIAEQHSGQMVCERASAGGARFALRLPLAPAPPAEPAPVVAEHAASTS